MGGGGGGSGGGGGVVVVVVVVVVMTMRVVLTRNPKTAGRRNMFERSDEGA